MKKLFLFILPVTIALCIGSNASAQSEQPEQSVRSAQSGQSAKQPKFAVGGFWALGSGPSIGLGGKFQFLATKNFRLEVSPAVLFGGESGILTTVLDLGVHAHYRFLVANLRIKDQELPAYIYPLAGLGVYRLSASGEILGEKVKMSETIAGADIGLGFEAYNPVKRLSAFTELKMGLGKGLSRFTFSVGVAYHF